MPTTINGTTGIDKVQSNVVETVDIQNGAITAPKLDGGQTGSAPIYGCRAWVNFNGTGTPAIRASGNVSSITDNGVGDYTINFTTPMPDANYAVVLTTLALSGNNHDNAAQIAGTAAAGPTLMTASAVRISTGTVTAAGGIDPVTVCVAIFR